MKLEGKVAIVTGSASGIGKAIATLFAKEGALEVAKVIEDVGGKTTAIVANVTKQEDIDTIIDISCRYY